MTLPVFETLKNNLDIHLAVLCNESVTPLLEHNPFVDEIIKIKSDIDQVDLVNSINEREFDTLLVLVNDPVILSLLPKLRNIPVRIGPLSKPKALFHYTHPVIQKRSRSLKNEAEYNLELLEIFGISPSKDVKPKLYLTESEKQAFRSSFHSLYDKNTDGKRIILHPGMKGSALNMSRDFYLGLINAILQNNCHIWLTGFGEKELSENQALINCLSKPQQSFITNVANAFNLRELAIFISECSLFIGPSTGPTHIANAVETPLVSFYPPVTVQSAIRWSPYHANSSILTPNVNCEQKYRCIEEKCPFFYCMNSITVDNTLEQIKKYLHS